MSKGSPTRFPSATQRRRLDTFFSDSRIGAYIRNHKWKVLDTFDIPDLSGYSVDPGTLYIDRQLAEAKPIIAGKAWPHWLPTLFGLDFVGRSVGHEMAEKAALDVLGLQYDEAHLDYALPCEHAVYKAIGMDWARGQKELKPWIRRTQLEDIEEPPPDLDCRPYYQDPGHVELKILARLAELGVKDAQHEPHPRHQQA